MNYLLLLIQPVPESPIMEATPSADAERCIKKEYQGDGTMMMQEADTLISAAKLSAKDQLVYFSR